MHSTSQSLLVRIRKATDDQSWQSFVDLYTPMIYRWVVGIGLPPSEVSDLVQDVLLTVFERINEFDYDAGRSFRSWLKTVAVNRARDYLRRRATRKIADSLSPELEISTPDTVAFLSSQEYNEQLTRRALEFAQSEFEESTWKACWMAIVEGKTTAEISSELGITTNAVYLAKSRVLRRLRSELEGLLEPHERD